jgi:DNA-binding NtrC family response regulator
MERLPESLSTATPDSGLTELPMIADAPPPPTSLTDYSVLVVEPALDDLVDLIGAISSVGLQVTATASFEQAKLLMSARTPSVLIAAIRLGIHNGLHLVLRGKAVRPDMAALVTAPEPDAVLQADADATGATFIVKPIAPPDLIAAILQTLFRRDQGAPPIRPPFERRGRERREGAAPFRPERREADRRRVLVFEAGGSA